MRAHGKTRGNKFVFKVMEAASHRKVNQKNYYLTPLSFLKIEEIYVDATVTESQLKLVLDKLDMVRLELLRLRAMLLPEEELSKEEMEELEEARREIAEGSGVNLEDLIKELG